MPYWMEAIVNDVPEKELYELRIILSKILDTDMSPLGFNAKKMYQFVEYRFQKTTAKVQQQALQWLQVTLTLNISLFCFAFRGVFCFDCHDKGIVSGFF